MTATTAIVSVSEVPKAAKSPKKKGAKAATTKAAHPPTAQMVNEAVKSLQERNGSSLQAIKKYIASTYKLDAEKLAIYIKKYLKSAVIAGTLVQTNGSGAAGSFKLPTAVAKKKPTKAGGQVKSPSKKTSSPKKKAPKQPKATVKKPAVAKAEKKPTKAKTAKKPPTTPKAPKPKKSIKSAAKAATKKAAPAKKAAAKKTSPKKK